MSLPSLRTNTTTQSTLIDDDLSMIVNDASETTVSTQTSLSWHSVRSDRTRNNHLFIRSPTINLWLKRCCIEPDIRLTTGQEWKLRICLRRFLTLSDHSLRLSIEKSDAMSTIDSLALLFHLPLIVENQSDSLQVKLIEFKSSSVERIIPMHLIKAPRFLFHVSTHVLKLSLRSVDSLLELAFFTRENQSIQGTYYKWNDAENSHQRFCFTGEIDQSLMSHFRT